MASSHTQLLLAATMRVGPPAAASHRSAADLWDLRAERERLEVVVPPCTQTRPRGVTVYRSRDQDPNHYTYRHGIPVTKPARTIIDLAAVLDRDELVEVIDRALVTRLVSQLGLRTMVSELARSGRRGPGVLREALDNHPLGGMRPESVIEPVMAVILRDSALANRFVYQHPVKIGHRSFRLDFALPHVKVGLEVLGLREHGTRAAVVDDSERRRLLRLAGWDLLEYTKHEMKRAPARVAREITAYVEARERKFPGWSVMV